MDKLAFITSKIVSWDELASKLAIYQVQQKKIVFTNGCFDIIHRGHAEYLAKASSLGDILVLGLNSDISVKKIKGESRPVQDEQSRAIILASFLFIDHVVLFDDDTPYELIKLVQPDILVKGGDYEPEKIVGYDIVRQKGGEVVTIQFVDGYSTTRIIQKMNS